MPDSVCEEMTNNHYLDFYKRYPHISVKITTADTDVMMDMLDHNEADIIITLDSHTYNKDYIIAQEMATQIGRKVDLVNSTALERSPCFAYNVKKEMVAL